MPTGAIRMEGTTKEYLPLEFPAVPDFSLLSKLASAAELLHTPYHIGVVQCKDSFYGQHCPESMPIAHQLQENWQAWKAAGTLGSEMKSAALFVVAAVRHLRCATVLQMIWNQEQGNVQRTQQAAKDDMTNAINVAIYAMKQIIQMDSERT